MSEKILIIDNDPTMLLLLSMLIKEDTPYESVTTNNPLEAIELLRQDSFSLVITEMKLPVLDGIELLEAVRHIAEDIPVILTAAYGSVESAIEAMRKGAFEYMTKPFRKEQMLYAIENALKRMKLQKENRMLREQMKKAEREQLLTTV